MDGNKQEMQETKTSKGCLANLNLQGKYFFDLGETQRIQFQSTNTGSHDMPHDERVVQHSIATKETKWVMKKLKSEIMPELWPLVLATLTAGILYVIKFTLIQARNDSIKVINTYQRIKPGSCVTILDVAMSHLVLKKATMKEIANAIIPKMEASGMYTYNCETFYLNCATCRLTTRDNDILMDMHCALCYKHSVSCWQKEIPTMYFAKEEPIHDLSAAVIPILIL